MNCPALTAKIADEGTRSSDQAGRRCGPKAVSTWKRTRAGSMRATTTRVLHASPEPARTVSPHSIPGAPRCQVIPRSRAESPVGHTCGASVAFHQVTQRPPTREARWEAGSGAPPPGP